ncbi:MAG: formate/nitrite transporter family protein [Bacillota bacterium]|nr:formate/nitrite transporter family protein [Bacillota bacterium]
MKHLNQFVKAILAGICIGLGGTAFLAVDNKIIGALLFTVGLFTILTNDLFLFTGKVCYAFNNPFPYVWTLLYTWAGNLVGCLIVGYSVASTRVGDTYMQKAQGICQTKLSDNLLSIFILSILCNILIYIAVDGFKNIPHEIGKYLAVFFGISVFIICGFEHCIANMFYFSIANMWGAKTLLYLAVMTIGNAVGGFIIPLLIKIGAQK